MHIFKEIGPLKAHLKHARSTQSSIGLVPTMGALHPGHLSLIEASRRQNTLTLSSIYVNPTQFNNPGDLAKYPRTLEQDLSLLREAGCDVVFCPDNAQMYSGESKLTFGFGGLDTVLEGEFRPGHFSGVALVVSKLFNIVQPDRAYFGQKDYQQFKIISRLVEEMKMGVSLICRPIVREEDGLAMSSRNKRLTSEERNRAIILYQSLKETRIRLVRGESLVSVQKLVKEQCEQHGVRLEYLTLADTENLALLSSVVSPEHSILLIAAYVGEVRLIDNLLISDSVIE